MATADSIFKFCKKCQVETERNKKGDCKPCARMSIAAWNAANPGRKKATNAAWEAANQERVKTKSAAWYAANPEYAKAKNAAWRAANPDRNKASNAAWKAANPEAVRVNNQNRRARKKENSGSLSRGLTAKLFKLQRGKCACCSLPLGANFHMDHIMPIALDGPNIDSNMQLLRQRCNLQKGSKHSHDFMQQRGFLL